MVGLGGRCRVPRGSGRWGTAIGPQNPLDYRRDGHGQRALLVGRCELYAFDQCTVACAVGGDERVQIQERHAAVEEVRGDGQRGLGCLGRGRVRRDRGNRVSGATGYEQRRQDHRKHRPAWPAVRNQ